MRGKRGPRGLSGRRLGPAASPGLPAVSAGRDAEPFHDPAHDSCRLGHVARFVLGVFLWKSVEDMTPFCPPKEVSIDVS